MTLERTLEILQAQPNGRLPMALLVDLLDKDPRQVRRWLSKLEAEGSVKREYLLDQPGRPCIVQAREWVCPTCTGVGTDPCGVLCPRCVGAGMVVR